jgi:hypothetical protein
VATRATLALADCAAWVTAFWTAAFCFGALFSILRTALVMALRTALRADFARDGLALTRFTARLTARLTVRLAGRFPARFAAGRLRVPFLAGFRRALDRFAAERDDLRFDAMGAAPGRWGNCEVVKKDPRRRAIEQGAFLVARP